MAVGYPVLGGANRNPAPTVYAPPRTPPKHAFAVPSSPRTLDQVCAMDFLNNFLRTPHAMGGPPLPPQAENAQAEARRGDDVVDPSSSVPPRRNMALSKLKWTLNDDTTTPKPKSPPKPSSSNAILNPLTPSPFAANTIKPRATMSSSSLKSPSSSTKSNKHSPWPTSSGVYLPSLDENKDDECVVCFSENFTDDDNIIFCDGCNVAVHQSCYGVDVIPEGDWFCEPCRKGIDSNTPLCQVCPATKGALLPTTKNRNSSPSYVHGCCALYTPGLDLDFGFVTIQNIDQRRRELGCGVCGESGGGTLQCSFPGCYAAFHAMCGRSRGATFDFRPESAVERGGKAQQKYWGPVAFCKAHSAPAHESERNRFLGRSEMAVDSETGLETSTTLSEMQQAANQKIKRSVALAAPRRAAWILSKWDAFSALQPARGAEKIFETLKRTAGSLASDSDFAAAVANAEKNASQPTPSTPQRTLSVGDRLKKQFEDGGWYEGTITAMTPKGKYPYSVTFDDGDVETYTAAQLMAQTTHVSPTALPTPTPTPMPSSSQRSIVKQPACIGGSMREYQLDGLQWMVAQHDAGGVGGVLGDEMGLGKTLQVISFLGYLKAERLQGGPHLVVAPLSVMPTWLSEIPRWCPSLRAVALHGNLAERNRVKHSALADPSTFDIVVTTYEMLVAEQNWLSHRFHFRYVVLDEAQRVKNEASLAGMAVRRMRKAGALLLTGTPLQNDLHELWALLNLLFPDVLATSEMFDTEKVWGGPSTAAVQADNAKLVNAARGVLQPIMLRRTKADVLASELPPLITLRVECPLAPLQRIYYKRVLEFDGLFGKLVAGTSGDDVGTARFTQLNNLMMQLRKVANHPYQLPSCEEPGADPDEPADERIWLSSGKMQVLDGVLTRLVAQGRKCIIFSQFTGFLNVIERALESREYRYLRLDGQTPAARRAYETRRFNEKGSPFVAYLVTTRAGGLGLNLQAADTVILADSDWNPQGDVQAQARSHRIGQKSPVTVLRLVSSGTCEERILQAAEAKLKLASAILEGDGAAGEGAAPSSGELIAAIKQGAEDALAVDSDAMRAAVTDGKRVVSEDFVNDIMNAAKAGGKMAHGTTAATIKSRSADSSANASGAKEPKSFMTFEGRTFDREAGSKRTIADAMVAEVAAKAGKRSRMSTVVMIDAGDGLGMQAVSKQSILDAKHIEEMEQRHAARIAAKKAASEGGNRHVHERYCIGCATLLSGREEDRHRGALTLKAARSAPSSWLGCTRCPRAACASCAALLNASSAGGGGLRTGWSCPQHNCGGCNRNASDAGGLVFRCVGCKWSRCWDCGKDSGFVPVDPKEMETHAWVSELGFPKACERAGNAEYVRCSECAL